MDDGEMPKITGNSMQSQFHRNLIYTQVIVK